MLFLTLFLTYPESFSVLLFCSGYNPNAPGLYGLCLSIRPYLGKSDLKLSHSSCKEEGTSLLTTLKLVGALSYLIHQSPGKDGKNSSHYISNGTTVVPAIKDCPFCGLKVVSRGVAV